MFKYLNYIIIAVLISLLLTLNIYFIWAQNNNKWPFHKDDKGDKNRFMKNKYLRDISSGDSSGSMSFGVIMVFILFFICIIVLMYFATKASIARYQFAGEAMKHGNNAVAAAALAPEIGQGVGAVLGDVFNPNYKYQNFN
jgi:hypothetical protein